MSWRGESWAEVVARAATARRRTRSEIALEDPAALAARASTWTIEDAHVAIAGDGLVLGKGMETLELGFAQVYHLEPVDPWPSLALGWIDRGDSYRTVLTPREAHADAFAAAVEDVVDTCARRVPRAVVRGWLDAPIIPWERTDAMPGEREERPAEQGYRMAPVAPDPIVATRAIAAGSARLWTWVWARFAVARRIEPREIVLTRHWVYARTREGLRLRAAAGALRTSRRTPSGDAVFVFGRNTELLVVFEPDCALTRELEARLESVA